MDHVSDQVDRLEPRNSSLARLGPLGALAVTAGVTAYLAWPARRSSTPAGTAARRGSRVLLGLVLVQIAAGGLVAGSKAGLTYNTWPLMDGALVPPASALFAVEPRIENFVDNVVLVQFNHRLVAYAIVAFAVWHAWTIRRPKPERPERERDHAVDRETPTRDVQYSHPAPEPWGGFGGGRSGGAGATGTWTAAAGGMAAAIPAVSPSSGRSSRDSDGGSSSWDSSSSPSSSSDSSSGSSGGGGGGGW